MGKEFRPKILMVHNYYQISGGEDTVVKNEKQLLENHGHEVVLYSRSNKEIKEFNFIQKLLLPINTIFSVKTFKEVKKIIKEQKIDIVHVHNTLSLVSPSVYYAAFSCKTPVVQTIHNFRMLCPSAVFYRDEHICEDCVSKGLICALKHKCYRGSLTQTAGSALNLKIHRLLGTYRKINYICLTEFNKRKLLDLNKGKKEIIDEQMIFVKPNFAFVNSFNTRTKRALDYYLFIGRIEKLKGIPLLYKAFTKMPELKIYLAGTGELFEEFKNKVEKDNVKNIWFLGQQNNLEIENLIWNAKAVILPSQWYEGFPMVIVESFALGTPIICSNIGNSGLLIEENKTGVKFKHDDYISIVGAIQKYETLDYNELSKNAYAVYKEFYSDEINYHKLMRIYRSSYKNRYFKFEGLSET